MNKVLPGGGTRVTVVPQGAKSPAKILPAPLNVIASSAGGQTASPQKVIIRQVNSTILLSLVSCVAFLF